MTAVNGEPAAQGAAAVLRDAPVQPGHPARVRCSPSGRTPPRVLKTWGTIDHAGTRRFVAINKDHRLGRRLVLTLPEGVARNVTVERLVAPGAKSENNVTFAGRRRSGTTPTASPRASAASSASARRTVSCG